MYFLPYGWLINTSFGSVLGLFVMGAETWIKEILLVVQVVQFFPVQTRLIIIESRFLNVDKWGSSLFG